MSFAEAESPVVLNDQPPAHNRRDVFQHVCTLRHAGLHERAISQIDEALRLEHRHDQVFVGMAFALKARSQAQISDDSGAMLSIGMVSPQIRRFNPKIDVYCRLVAGFVQRRRAHRDWKAGVADHKAALGLAVDNFAAARCAAENGIEDRLAFAAELNRLYALGLEAAIAGSSQQQNPRLLVDAIPAEAGARRKSPADEASNVAGLTMIADLAIGGGMEPHQLFGLSNATSFRVACLELFGSGGAGWSQLLLRAGTAFGVPPVQKARALVLGSRYLMDSQRDGDQRLIQSYMVHLFDCQLRIQSLADGSATAIRPIPGLIEQLEQLRRISTGQIPNRRTFR